MLAKEGGNYKMQWHQAKPENFRLNMVTACDLIIKYLLLFSFVLGYKVIYSVLIQLHHFIKHCKNVCLAEN